MDVRGLAWAVYFNSFGPSLAFLTEPFFFFTVSNLLTEKTVVLETPDYLYCVLMVATRKMFFSAINS
uniref:Uncharacterized protein n=1 Tax=Lepeophtheirus salmonis TaxID=72036 RepID=A0A0K2SZL1_LEPSM